MLSFCISTQITKGSLEGIDFLVHDIKDRTMDVFNYPVKLGKNNHRKALRQKKKKKTSEWHGTAVIIGGRAPEAERTAPAAAAAASSASFSRR